ncbi:MAG TPA: hypothetical protein VGD55_02390, partial [Acidothermaceae bacterium]
MIKGWADADGLAFAAELEVEPAVDEPGVDEPGVDEPAADELAAAGRGVWGVWGTHSTLRR